MQDTYGGRQSQKARTRRDLLDTATRLVREGQRPTIDDVATAAGISRRTAYRYYRSQEHLLADVALENTRPEIAEALAAAGDGEERVLKLLAAMHQGNLDHGPHLRAMLAASLADEEDDRTAPQRRGIRRLDWVRQAADPLRDELSPESFERLISALTVIAGYDAYRILREIRRLPDDEIESVVGWMARALIGAAKAENYTIA